MHPIMEMLPFLVPKPGLHAPARVLAAMEYLRDLTVKTMDRAAISDVSIEVLPGSKLSECELDTRVAACSVLQDYFLGRLAPSQQEALDHKEDEEADIGGTMRCLACDPRKTTPNCIYCKGSGFIFVLPAPSEE